jgi:hypothetical protein
MQAYGCGVVFASKRKVRTHIADLIVRRCSPARKKASEQNYNGERLES